MKKVIITLFVLSAVIFFGAIKLSKRTRVPGSEPCAESALKRTGTVIKCGEDGTCVMVENIVQKMKFEPLLIVSSNKHPSRREGKGIK